jgi:hypothetical protein
MKKILNRIKWFFVMAFAAVTSFVSKALWSGFDFTNYPAQPMYWVEGTIGRVPDPEPSLLFTVLSFLFKWIEVILLWIVFILWIVSYFKIRKIEDKNIKANKIKNIAIVVWIIVFIIVLIVILKWLFSIGIIW